MSVAHVDGQWQISPRIRSIARGSRTLTDGRDDANDFESRGGFASSDFPRHCRRLFEVSLGVNLRHVGAAVAKDHLGGF